MSAEVSGVISGSIAEEIGLKKGDLLMSINGMEPQDIIDYRYLICDQEISIEVENSLHERIIFEIEKDEDEDLGIVFAQDTFNGLKKCQNKCVFCFVDQMPSNLRETLYLKDDDYRLSFLYGNFITLTNISDAEIARIKAMHISPLYISVHTTNGSLRKKMMNNTRAENIYALIETLAEGGIQMHTQIVLCPGVNDGEELAKSVHDLGALWPHVQSVAVVPVGLTKFREDSVVRSFKPDEAREVVDAVSLWQRKFQNRFGVNFVYLGDELYLLARAELPSFPQYDGFPQIENGVGMVRFFWQGFERIRSNLPKKIKHSRKIVFATGKLAAPVLEPVVERLNHIDNLSVSLVAIENRFFGPSVTVAGLLTGDDLVNGIEQWKKNRNFQSWEVFIPSVMLKYGEDFFLDGTSRGEIEKKLHVKITVVEPTAERLVKALTNLNG